MTNPARSFWTKVEEDETGCWLWRDSLLDGYGVHAGRLAHRLAYEELVTDIPAGLELDHLCRVPACVNPFHVDPVTKAENMRRQGLAQTRCRQGHEYTTENTYVRPSGHRDCRACIRARATRYRERKVAA